MQTLADLQASFKAPWTEISEETADYWLGVLPPIYFRGGFFCSEPEYHDGRGVPAYTAVVKHKGLYYKRVVVQDRIEAAVAALVTRIEP